MPDRLREWTVAGAIIENGEGVLLVQNLRRNGSFDWTPPGGVIEVADGESLLDGLTREVREETGLMVTAWTGPLYRVTTTAAGMGWRMHVEVYRADRVEGQVSVGDDPDGIVVDAVYVAPHDCHLHLVDGHPWVGEPLGEWLVERWEGGVGAPHYRYDVRGTGLDDAVVARVAGLIDVAPGGSREARVRRILHVDMDAFFVGVELRERPELIGRPVVVGGSGPRGVVAAASYEARFHGVHSAMPSAIARRLCPDAVFLPGRHGLYSEVSAEVMAIFRDVTPLVEPLSLDEAFLDVTGRVRALGPAAEIGALLRTRVLDETGLWCSVGVATSKFLAKLGSQRAKPRPTATGPLRGSGVFEVPPGGEIDFLHPLPLEALWGVGPATLGKLQRLGLTTVGDLARLPPDAVRSAVGVAHGDHLVRLALAEDDRPVVAGVAVKSVSHEMTFATDIVDRAELHRELVRLSDAVAARLREAGSAGRTVQIKVRDPSFRTVTRSVTFADSLAERDRIQAAAQSLLDGLDVSAGVRLLGVGVHQLTDAPVQQLAMTFGSSDETRGDADRVVGEIRRRFGRDAIGPAVLVDDGSIGTFEQGQQQWGPSDGRGRPRTDR